MNLTRVFLCGPLADPDLLRSVLGGDTATMIPATLPGYRLVRDAKLASAALTPSKAAAVHGMTGLFGSAHIARLEFFAVATGMARLERPLAGATEPAAIYAVIAAGDDVDFGAATDWTAQEAALDRATAQDIMRLMGQVAPDRLAARKVQLRVRAASRLRARDAAPSSLRQSPDTSAVRIHTHSQPYARFFAVEEYDLTVRRFDGTDSVPMNRAVFVTGDAVTVLPYDLRRDRVLLIEQFRAGPLGRGDPVPWSLEAIAGRIDPGETPEQAARREAVEEAGLVLGRFWPVANYYPSPAAKSEFLYSYVAEADLPDGVAGLHGLADEAEDIRGHLVGFDDLMDMVATGEVGNAPVILTALWLQRERLRLRAFTGSG